MDTPVKSIGTLVGDINKMLSTREVSPSGRLHLHLEAQSEEFNWANQMPDAVDPNALETPEGSASFFKDMVAAMDKQILGEGYVPSNTLRMSNLGTPCITNLWDQVNDPVEDHTRVLSGADTLKFLFGDMLEALLLALTKAAGHKVELEQLEVRIDGIVGHIDCIIDGVLIDVKSASQFAFDKFKKGGGLLKRDDFGYLSQLSSYLYSLQGNPALVNKTEAGFLVINKATGEISLDMYDMTEFLETKAHEVEIRKGVVASSKRPDYRMPDQPQSKGSENRKLNISCQYCPGKHKCYPNLRSFRYSNGIVHLTKVVSEPKVDEIGAGPVVVPSGDTHVPDF